MAMSWVSSIAKCLKVRNILCLGDHGRYIHVYRNPKAQGCGISSRSSRVSRAYLYITHLYCLLKGWVCNGPCDNHGCYVYVRAG